MVLLSSSKAKSSVSAWERHMRIARWAGFVRVLSLLLLTSLFAYAQQKGDFAGLVEIGAGRKMFLECRGSGSPTVILESGTGVVPTAGAPRLSLERTLCFRRLPSLRGFAPMIARELFVTRII